MAVCRQDLISPELVIRMMRDDDEETGNLEVLSPVVGSADELHQALAKTRGRLKEAAALLGISRSTLWRRMNAHGLHEQKRRK